jgi:methyltransferase (TIGR00027 family)
MPFPLRPDPPAVTSIDGLGHVQATMLIALWARAREHARPDAIVRDALAARLVETLEFDFSRFHGAWKSQVGVAVRTRFMDETVRRFLARHRHAVVVNIGAGLDTRFHRVDDGRVHWLDLDLPDAINLRRDCLAESPRNRYLAGCVLDESWIEHVLSLGPRPVLLISEGVLMFLPLSRVQRMFGAISRALPGAEMVFDCIGGLMVRCPWLHDTLPGSGVRFSWGLRGAADLSRWHDGCRVIGFRSMLDEHPERWRWMRHLRRVPVLRRQFAVAHVRFDPVTRS